MDPEPVLLTADRHGVVRVGETRVTLESVVEAFRDEATAEEIAQQYPTLQLSVLYSVIGYYLRHRHDVDVYLGDRRRAASEVRQDNEARFGPVGIRDPLRARHAQ